MNSKLGVIFLIFMWTFCTEGQEKDKETLTNPLDYLTNPKFAAAVEAAKKLKDLVHTSSSSHITTREKTSGFEFLDIKANAQSSKGLKKKHILKIIKRNLVPFTKTNKDMKDVVDTLVEFIQDDVEEHQEQFFAIVSEGGAGKTQAIFVYYKLRDDGKYNFKRLMFRGSFRLAADLVITRSEKKSFFKSSSKDIIRYLPRRGITAKDVNDLLAIIVPKIAVVMNDFIPPE